MTPLAVHVEDLEARTSVPYAFIKSPVRVGRGELNDLTLDAPFVSTWHGVTTEWAPELIDALGARCDDPESGARNVDHVLRGSLLPVLSRGLLERMASGARTARVEVGLAADGGWRLDFADA